MDPSETGSVDPVTQRMGFFLVPHFSMMALSSVTEPLRAANRVSGKPLYSWHLISVDGEPVSSSSGFALLPEFAITSSPEFSHLFVVASIGVSDYRNAQVFDFLRRYAATGLTLGGISLGTMILARAGLLDRRRCTIHWEALRELAEEFPSLDVSRDIYCIDGDRMTCSGGTAAIDMMLELIARQHGHQMAGEVADQFIHTRMRTAQESQKMAIQWRYGVEDRRIVNAITLMEQNIERPIPMKTIASLAGISPRTFERMWLKHFSVRPSQFYLELRLKAAQKLIRESTWSLLDIAMHCGFASPSHLGRCYKQCFGKTPGQERAISDVR
ncbi:GlxA family transcriptional regulator [Paraburkholderia sartisoli]|uniref:Transcriptional regulator GlxA family, contains an amidase domain and an AraC-type DNA-binding HTH domain n=1 Tax=Paraburkholderia sartisoli TaxID=83784 RepID=A0A1H4F042_9BURK|nr:GlxA family transcriptional regulator [Paraburkholderia sartisoli]SEA90539.1 Transcriptional regulator GlxA family, contains an amidase domain and an AraC-type DNA-binding HTH domain [Paraburkholderia sartisoli]